MSGLRSRTGKVAYAKWPGGRRGRQHGAARSAGPCAVALAGIEGTVPSDRLYSAPAAEVDYALVRQFVLDAEAADLFTESLTFEAKEKRNSTNVVEAVAALSNTDGGIVLVGVKDGGAAGEDRITGVPKSEHDTLVSQMRSLIPNAMPEVIPVARRGTDQLVIVLRVDADAVLHPVMVNGKVLYRLPGQKAPADRQRVIDMIARDTPGRPSPGRCRSSPGLAPPGHPAVAGQ